ncbi:MAG: hypothetical protein K5756_02550 [Clostridiales bacterium]|nr:hypothetical protein [Clostridiales bacterium]
MVKKFISAVLLVGLVMCFPACGNGGKGRNSWPTDAFFGDKVPAAADEVSSIENFGKKGSRRTVIYIDEYPYDKFLDYVDRLEAAGFTEIFNKNSVYPTEPRGEKAMFASNNVEGACIIMFWYPEDYIGREHALNIQITENDTIDQ